MKAIIERVRSLFLKPAQTFVMIHEDNEPNRSLALNFLLPMTAVPALSMLLGFWVIGFKIPFSGTYRFSFFQALFLSILNYVLIIAGIWILSKWFGWLARAFRNTGPDIQPFKLAVYIHVPLIAAGVFYLIPSLSPMVLLIGLYGFFLLYTGLPVLMDRGENKSWTFLLSAGIGVILIHLIITWVTGWVLGLFGPNLPSV